MYHVYTATTDHGNHATLIDAFCVAANEAGANLNPEGEGYWRFMKGEVNRVGLPKKDCSGWVWVEMAKPAPEGWSHAETDTPQ